MNTEDNQNRFWQSTSQMEMVLSNLHTGIFIIDRETMKILEINETSARMIGQPRSEIVGHRCRDILCTSEEGACPIHNIGEKSITRECTIRTAEGTLIPVMKSISALSLNGHDCVLETIMDISAQKAVENRLREERKRVEQLAREAAEASRAKSEFLANISHELRTPLNGVVGMASLLRETKLTSDQECYTDTMYVCAESLLKLVNGVLDYSNLEAGQIALTSRLFNPTHLLRNVMELIRETAEKKKLTLKTIIDPDVPRQVIGDPSRLQQALMVITDNALKFTDTGYIQLMMKAEPASPDHVRLLFSVIDTGIGIPAESREYIFERFTQVDSSSTRKYGGTGLGLATAKEIVRLMDGTIGVRDNPDGGSEFWLTVPLPLSDTPPQPESPEKKTLRGHILVVDDSRTNREVMSNLLKKLSFECTTATGGEDAVALCSTTRFDLIFMDIQMPNMNGLAATKAIRAGLAGPDAEDIPIVALSANELSDNTNWRKAGMNQCMTKPVTPDHLAEFLDGWYEKRALVKSVPPSKASVARPGNARIFDRAKLLERLMGDSHILTTVLDGFIDDIPRQINQLATLIENGQMDDARIRVHGIKGASATVCAERMSAHCAQMEQLAEQGDKTALALGVIELRTLFYELKNETAQKS
jgi:PAS domain S-box-containing protein